MQRYLVGGAVRDRLLGLDGSDRDWVVIGETMDSMRARGFRQVGRDFPVFLHPETGEEYALARIERKIARGHQGFCFDFHQNITLEEDLIRRDLTINAMAEDENGQLIDPYGGSADIQAKILRHVSPAFSEDPLRVLRLMRFWARFAHLGFTIAPETLQLCGEMARSGELQTLTAERVWQECEKALKAPNPECFLMGLAQIHALNVLFGATQPSARQLAAMNQRLMNTPTLEAHQRLARCLWHEKDLIAALKKQMPLPQKYHYWLDLVAQYGESLQNWQHISGEQRWAILKACGGLRAAGDVFALAQTCSVDEALQTQIIAAQKKVNSIQANDVQKAGFSGAALGAELKRRQIILLTD